DSVKHMLSYFQTNEKNEQIRLAIAETQKLYKKDKVDTSIAQKLLDLEDLLVEFSDSKRQLVVAFAETLAEVLRRVSPVGGNAYYARSLNTLADLYTETRQNTKA